MSKIQRALISVTDKSNLVPFARTLAKAGVEILSTGGTAGVLREAGLEVRDISELTGFPEMLDGRVKTLHPKVHGGLLFVRGNKDHEKQATAHGIVPIDLVVVNLYQFEKSVANPGVTLEEAIEQIDIGGPSMLRSAAKNHAHVTVVVDPADYARVAAQIRDGGDTSAALRRELAAKVFDRTASYDRAIATYMSRVLARESGLDDDRLPDPLLVKATKAQSLRYGENPHQRAALYGEFDTHFHQLHGKALSYNNILDLAAATHLITEFAGQRPTLAILKHTNPCGVGQGDDLHIAWEKAFATDRQAPFGGIIIVNQPLDEDCAGAIGEIFSEVIIAPGFSGKALAVLQKKKNLRLIELKRPLASSDDLNIRSVGFGSFLAQEHDCHLTPESEWEVPTRRQPSESELQAMRFGWRVVKHVKSNAIVYTGADRTLGVGAGQMSRVDSSRIAVWKASEAGLSLQGSVVCSDAFFPFADGLIAAAEAGATAAIQPGGSVRDEEVIAAADERNLAMVFTRTRHFRH